MHKNETIESLQALRAVAALLVVLYHMSLSAYPTSQSAVVSIFGFGFAGVDLFFVLSGFIIYHSSVSRENVTTGSFLQRRFIRIYPIYWVAMLPVIGAFVATRIFSSLCLSHTAFCNSLQEGGGEFVLASMFLLPFTSPPIVAVSWTLSFEILFYLVFGLFFFRSRKLFFTVLSGWVVLSQVLSFLVVIDFNAVGRYSLLPILNPIVSEFLFGCVVAVLVRKYPARYSGLSLWLGIFLFLLAAALGAGHGWHRELTYGVPAAFIIYGLAHVKARFPVFVNYLGDASYSIYLFHVTLLSTLTKSVFFQSLGGGGSLMMAVFVFVLIVLACCLAHTYIEKPLIFWSKKCLQFTSAKTLEKRLFDRKAL